MMLEVYNNSSHSQNRNAATDDESIAERLAFIIVNTCLNFLASVLNTVVIAVYWENKELITKANVNVVAMALAAIVLAFSEVCITIAGVFQNDLKIDSVWCLVQDYLEIILRYFIIQLIAVTSVQRQCIVSKIMTPNTKGKLWTAKLRVAIIFIAVAFLTLPFITSFDTIHINTTIYLNSYQSEAVEKSSICYSLVHVTLLFILPTLVILSSYIYIFVVIKKKSRALHHDLRRSVQSISSRRIDKKLCQGILVIVLIYMSTLLPIHALMITENVTTLRTPKQFIYFTVLISNSFLQFSSFLHVFMSTRYRYKFRQLITKREDASSVGYNRSAVWGQINHKSMETAFLTREPKRNRAQSCSAAFLKMDTQKKNCLLRPTASCSGIATQVSVSKYRQEMSPRSLLNVPIITKNCSHVAILQHNDGTSGFSRLTYRRFTETDLSMLKENFCSISNNALRKRKPFSLQESQLSVHTVSCTVQISPIFKRQEDGFLMRVSGMKNRPKCRRTSRSLGNSPDFSNIAMNPPRKKINCSDTTLYTSDIQHTVYKLKTQSTISLLQAPSRSLQRLFRIKNEAEKAYIRESTQL